MATVKKTVVSPVKLILSFSLFSLVGVFLLLIRIYESDSTRYVFLLWNLVLAALAPLLAWWLVVRIRAKGWLKLPQIGITLAWLLFLPNSFYIITDFIHLRPNYEATILYDAVMLTSFTVSGLILGFLSVYLVHVELLKRLTSPKVWSAVALVFLASSFAIYLGRFSRWNSWDIIFKPAGLLFDVSDRVVNPAIHAETYVTTSILFMLLFSLYWVIWESAAYVRARSHL